MKKKIIATVLIIALLMSISSVAYAGAPVEEPGRASFSATKCRIGFTTTASVSTSSQRWSGIDVYLTKLEYEPVLSSNQNKYIHIKPVTTGGIQAGSRCNVYCDGYTEFLSIWSAYNQQSELKLRIDNPYSNTDRNAVVSGYFSAVGV